jgi:O-antigen/teichoic acid export membrane protein
VNRESPTPTKGLRGLLDQLGPVAAGLVVLGLGSFIYLSIAGRALGPVGFAPVATLWVIFNATALALYQPFEQELSRATAHLVSRGAGARSVLLRCLLVGSGVTAVLAVLAAVFWRPVSTHAFDGVAALVPLLLVGVVGLFAEHVMRGLFSGNGRFGRYGGQLATDGLLRVVLPLLVLLTAAHTAAWFGAALVLAPLAAALATAGRPGRLATPGPPVAWREILSALGALISAAVLSQLIVNAAPLAAQLLADEGEADRAGVFIAALVMTRIPLFFFGAVQAAFLPALARLSAHGDRRGFLVETRTVLLLVAGAGGAFILGLAAVGPWALQLLYGPAFVAGRGLLVVLGAGAAAYMVAQALAQTLVALQSYRSSLIGWALGAATFFAGLALPAGLEARVSGALLGGGLVAACAMAVLFVRAVRRHLDAPAALAR